jgi:hypothetical protein
MAAMKVNTMGHSEPGAWGVGDTISVAGGVIYLILAWRRLPARRNFEGFTVFLATGVSLAPLILILVDRLFNLCRICLGSSIPLISSR